MDSGKKWYTSKTLWVNAIALVAILLQELAGIEISGKAQLSILGVINMILRLVTKEKLRK